MRKFVRLLVYAQCAYIHSHMADEGEEDAERQRSVRARAERMRAERRRRIGENAKSRMEKVMSMQQRWE